jgi:hypothetical protein
MSHTPFANANVAGWSSPVARQAHNLKVTGSNPVPATNLICNAFPVTPAEDFCVSAQAHNTSIDASSPQVDRQLAIFRRQHHRLDNNRGAGPPKVSSSGGQDRSCRKRQPDAERDAEPPTETCGRHGVFTTTYRVPAAAGKVRFIPKAPMLAITLPWSGVSRRSAAARPDRKSSWWPWCSPVMS